MDMKCESTHFLAEVQEVLDIHEHGCKSWVTNLSVFPTTLGILTAKATCCFIFLRTINESQVNERLVIGSECTVYIPSNFVAFREIMTVTAMETKVNFMKFNRSMRLFPRELVLVSQSSSMFNIL